MPESKPRAVPRTRVELDAVLSEKHFPHLQGLHDEHGLSSISIVCIEDSTLSMVFSPFSRETTIGHMRRALKAMLSDDIRQVPVPPKKEDP